jgi:hypothetical protein
VKEEVKGEQIEQSQSDNLPPRSQLAQQFLTFCSYIFRLKVCKFAHNYSDIKDLRNISYAKLCLIILTCLVEDESTNLVMHDSNFKYQLPIYQKSKVCNIVVSND